MKIRILICVLFILSSFQLVNNDNTVKASYEIDVYLSNGETYNYYESITSVDYSVPLNVKYHTDTLDYISASESHILTNSAIIKSFNTDNFKISNIIYEINNIDAYNDIHLLSYWGDLSEWEFGGSWAGTDFYKYYHSLFQSKFARKLLFEAALNIIENKCIKFPKDFLDRVLYEVRHLISLTESKDNYESKLAGYSIDHKKCINGPCSYNKCSLKNWDLVHGRPHEQEIKYHYIDGTNGHYLEGFIHRRVEIDKIPLSEIHSYLLQTEERLLQLNKNNLNDEMYKFNIDKDVCITVSNSEEPPYGVTKIHNKNKVVQLPRNSRQVTLHKDNSGTYYLIWDYELNRGGRIRELYNQDLELID